MSADARSQYYGFLLPYQTRGLPNATRQIQLWSYLMTGSDLYDQLLNAFNIDTAVGKQLDVIGKYVGVPRNVGIVLPRAFFGLWASAQPDLDPTLYQGTWNPVTNIPALGSGTIGEWWVTSAAGTSTSPIAATWTVGQVILRIGSSTFVQFTTDDPNGNGLTSSTNASVNANGVFYSTAYLSGQNSDLSDVQYRTVIKLQIVLNSSNGTLASIMDYLHQFFPGQIALVDNKNMTMDYYVLSTVALSKELLSIYLPKPMGVGITVTIVSPTPGGADELTTEGGDILTTELADILTTEPV
jgi:hypothetical protein